MENLIKQTRSRFGGNKEVRSISTTDNKFPPQKPQTFKDKKRSQSWTKKQVSRQMSWEYDFSSSEYPTAIAAAAYAIQSLEQSNKKEREYRNHKSLSKPNSRVDDTEEKPEPLKSALKSSDENSRSSFSDESSSKRLGDKRPTKKISFADMNEISNNKSEKFPFQKPPPLKKPPSFTDHQMNMADLAKPEQRPPPTHPGPSDSAADAWEKEEMISIKERYGKLSVTIDNWELKKKKKVQSKIERTEAELGERKSRNIRKYNDEIARIEEIANGAREQAQENHRKEELKVKEKANKIRATGKLPTTCLCF